MCPIFNGLLTSLLLAGAIVSTCRAAPRETISLDGVWNFATDPGNRGETEKWYLPRAKLTAKVFLAAKRPVTMARIGADAANLAFIIPPA
jgi:hypothetical protein